MSRLTDLRKAAEAALSNTDARVKSYVLELEDSAASNRNWLIAGALIGLVVGIVIGWIL